ncbi:MAG TPA: hypothetical protein VGB78_06045 [Thermoplasmata archaeon]
MHSEDDEIIETNDFVSDVRKKPIQSVTGENRSILSENRLTERYRIAA